MPTASRSRPRTRTAMHGSAPASRRPRACSRRRSPRSRPTSALRRSRPSARSTCRPTTSTRSSGPSQFGRAARRLAGSVCCPPRRLDVRLRRAPDSSRELSASPRALRQYGACVCCRREGGGRPYSPRAGRVVDGISGARFNGPLPPRGHRVGANPAVARMPGDDRTRSGRPLERPQRPRSSGRRHSSSASSVGSSASRRRASTTRVPPPSRTRYRSSARTRPRTRPCGRPSRRAGRRP